MNKRFSTKDESKNKIADVAYKAIKEWREDERPRERLLQHGSSTLSDAELLAIIIGSGTIKFSAIDIAKTLLERFNTLQRLSNCDISELKQIKGMGFAKSVTLAATFELSRRIKSEPFDVKRIINSPFDIANYYIAKMGGARTEAFVVVLLTSSNTIIRDAIVSEGTLNSSIVHPREVFRLAITENAASIILLHNHPSGNTEPSKEDINITNQLIEAGKLLGIKVLDHIIIAGDQFTSFLKKGLM